MSWKNFTNEMALTRNLNVEKAGDWEDGFGY